MQGKNRAEQVVIVSPAFHIESTVRSVVVLMRTSFGILMCKALQTEMDHALICPPSPLYPVLRPAFSNTDQYYHYVHFPISEDKHST